MVYLHEHLRYAAFLFFGQGRCEEAGEHVLVEHFALRKNGRYWWNDAK